MPMHQVVFLVLPVSVFLNLLITGFPPLRKNGIFYHFHHRLIKISLKCLKMHYVSDPHKHLGVQPILHVFHFVRRKLDNFLYVLL